MTSYSLATSVSARSIRAGALLMALACAPQWGLAQTAVVEGTISSFDVVNDSGVEAHGFEIQIEGALPGDLYYTVPGGRYGQPAIVPYTTGVYIRWTAKYLNGQYSATTPKHVPGSPFSWNDCYTAGSTYSTSGCEHLGQYMRPTPPGQITKITGRWLIDDPANHGTLIGANPPAAIPFAAWTISPPVTVATPPVVVAEVEAPEPPETPEKYGDAQWVKVYKTQLNRFVAPDELTSDNSAVVPESAAQVEVAWDIVQASPPSNSNGNQRRSRKQNQGSIAVDTRAVVRRYEFFKYTGTYDPLSHLATCADGTCTAPSAGELGDALSAQNTAVNLTADSLVITRSGSGSVGGANGKINCGGTCGVFALNGSVLSVTANPGGTVFTGWTGACSGTALTCTVSVNKQVNVGATFKNLYTLSVGRSNPGTVTGSPSGNDRVLDCGGNCSAKFLDGTAVTLTATPPAGKTFVNWSGACSGTAPTCVVTITRDTSVQAVFSK